MLIGKDHMPLGFQQIFAGPSPFQGFPEGQLCIVGAIYEQARGEIFHAMPWTGRHQS